MATAPQSSEEVERELIQDIRVAQADLNLQKSRRKTSETKAVTAKKEALEVSTLKQKLSLKVEAYRQKLRALQGEDVGDREKEFVPFEEAVARVSPEQAIHALKAKLDQVESLLKGSSNTSSLELPDFVVVQFSAESCSFCLSRATTFKSLKDEACSHWKVHVPSLLKNANDEDWNDEDIVQIALAKEKEKTGVTASVRLHLIITTKRSTDKPQTDASRIAPPSNKRKQQQAAQIGNNDSNAMMAFEELPQSKRVPASKKSGDGVQPAVPGDTKAQIRQKEKEAWEAGLMQMSPVFFDPEFAVKSTLHSSPSPPGNQIGRSESVSRNHAAGSCCGLLWSRSV